MFVKHLEDYGGHNYESSHNEKQLRLKLIMRSHKNAFYKYVIIFQKTTSIFFRLMCITTHDFIEFLKLPKLKNQPAKKINIGDFFPIAVHTFYDSLTDNSRKKKSFRTLHLYMKSGERSHQKSIYRSSVPPSVQRPTLAHSAREGPVSAYHLYDFSPQDSSP